MFIIYFIAILVLSAQIGFSAYSFMVGKFPTTHIRYRNYILWGDGNINPRLLIGKRAKHVSILVLLLVSLFTISLLGQNNLFGNIILTNLISISIGIIIGIFWSKNLISKES